MPKNVKHVLFAVALSKGEISDSSRHAFEEAVLVAKRTDARLTLLHVVEVSEKVGKQILDAPDSPGHQHYLEVQGLLGGMSESARQAGLKTVETDILFGKAWTTIIRAVTSRNADLLIAGSARRGPVLESLFGSTTLKLVRKCPCPVWVTKPPGCSELSSVLVAHDLTPVGSAALRWGVAAAQQNEAELHILHTLEPDEHHRFLKSVPSHVVKQKMKQATDRIKAEVEKHELRVPPRIIVTKGSPQVEIHNYLRKHSIELLVMGTLARTGLSGVITGNTAETLLPWVRCSLIALKPEGFSFKV